MASIDTDPKKIKELLTRGISDIYPSEKELEELLKSGKKIRAYLGMDATGPDLHLGHTTKLIVMEKLRRMGHEIVILFGDFTAMIGDPSDKKAARKQLTPEEVDKNLKSWRKQIAKIIDIEDSENPARIVKNSEWLSKLGFEEILNLSSHFTVQQMIERNMFEKRIKSEKPIHLHEFLYPLMQGYDSVALDVNLEVGGSDQIFNMLAGRTLLKKIKNKEKCVLASELLQDPDTGEKLMSKSEGSYIALNDDPADMFGKVMALSDKSIVMFFKDATFKSLEGINRIEKELDNGVNPKEKKMELAEEIVSMCYNSQKAKDAKEEFVKTFEQKSAPSDIPQIKVSRGDSLAEKLKQENFVSSKSDFNRLLKEGAIKDVDTSEKIEEDLVDKNRKIKIGKRRFVEIRLK